MKPLVSKIIKIAIVAAVIAGLILPFINLQAAETNPAAKPETIKEVSQLVDDLTALKSNGDLSDLEKERQEIAIRTEALAKILYLSKLEVRDLQVKLEGLNLDKIREQEIKKQFMELLKTYEEYYQVLENKLKEGLALWEIKELTKNLQEWRRGNYGQKVSLIANFIMVFKEKDALETADARLEKIMSDLKKLESAKLIQRETLQSYLNASIQQLSRAKLLNKKASDLLFSAASATFSTAPAEIGKKTEDAKQLIKESFYEIKSAYQSFLEISKKVKQQLSL
ncbi:MAG: hypothetical protein Q8P76_03255 [bacterium]|nr:hypothetical protein [bacterium]